MPTYNIVNERGIALKQFTTSANLPNGVHNMVPVGEFSYQLRDASTDVTIEFTSNIPLTQGPVTIRLEA